MQQGGQVFTDKVPVPSRWDLHWTSFSAHIGIVVHMYTQFRIAPDLLERTTAEVGECLGMKVKRVKFGLNIKRDKFKGNTKRTHEIGWRNGGKNLLFVCNTASNILSISVGQSTLLYRFHTQG